MLRATVRLRFVICIVIALVAIFVAQRAALAQNGPIDPDQPADPVATQVVVKLNPLAGATITAINDTYGTTTLKPLLNSAGIYLLQASAGNTAKAIAEAMEGDLRLLYAEPNFVGEIPEGVGRHTWSWGDTNATPLDSQYAINLLGLPAAWQRSLGAGVVVAVLDSGVQLDHPALASVWTPERYDFVDDDGDPQMVADGATPLALGHGTHIAGIIHLVAPQARIMPLRVLDNAARGDIFLLAEAIIYATDHGAKVINMSLGTSEKSELLDEVTRRATALGVTVVAAAGNLNEKERQYPAGSQCVLAVTALDEKRQKADFANYGSWIDFAAPGVSIYSTLPSNGYGWWSGTSMATPWVAGQAALIYSINSNLNVRQIASLMAGTARSVDRANPQIESELGQGLPAIDVSLAQLQAGNLPHVGEVMSGGCVESASPTVTAAGSEQAPAALAGEPIQENTFFLPLVRQP